MPPAFAGSLLHAHHLHFTWKAVVMVSICEMRLLRKEKGGHVSVHGHKVFEPRSVALSRLGQLAF